MHTIPLAFPSFPLLPQSALLSIQALTSPTRLRAPKSQLSILMAMVSPDQLFSDKDSNLAAGLSPIGRTNLLKRVIRPLGASFDISYDRSGNTYDQPQNRWVMSRVDLHDGFAGDGADTQSKIFAYENGFWERREREFYGFARVIEDHVGSG